MAKQVFSNNASTTLASGINSLTTSIDVQPAAGALFPAPTGGDYFMITMVDTNGQVEIAKCTSRTGDTLTIVRGQEGTSPRTFSTGDTVELRITAAGIGNLHQILELFTRSGTYVGLNQGTPGYTFHVGGDIYATGEIASSSGVATKEMITPIADATEIVNRLRGVFFNRKVNGQRNMGLIAEEVRDVVPEVVRGEGASIGVIYQNLVALLIEANKELNQRITKLEESLHG